MVSLVPRPFDRGEEKGPGTHCLRMLRYPKNLRGPLHSSVYYTCGNNSCTENLTHAQTVCTRPFLLLSKGLGTRLQYGMPLPTYLHLCVSPAWHLNNHVERFLVVTGIEWNVMKGRYVFVPTLCIKTRKVNPGLVVGKISPKCKLTKVDFIIKVVPIASLFSGERHSSSDADP